MADAPADPPTKPRPATRRWLLLVFAGVLAIGATFALLPSSAPSHKAAEEAEPVRVVSPPPAPLKREPVTLGIEYHFDRNAIVDTRIVGGEIVALTAAGNLVIFDGNTFEVRREKVFRRRVTCLGPVDGKIALAGLANGSIVQVELTDLAVREVADVPGQPRWIGKRRDGGLMLGYQSVLDARVVVRDQAQGRNYDLANATVLFLDSKDRLWSGSRERVQVLDLGEGTQREVAWKAEWQGLRGLVELSDGQVWAFGGDEAAGDKASYIVRVAPGAKAVALLAGKLRPVGAPTLAVTHVIEDREGARLIVVSQDGVWVTSPELSVWQPLDAMVSGHRDEDALLPVGQAHLLGARVLLTSARGGFLEVTADFTRRHQLDGQYSVSRLSAIVRLAGGTAFYGDGGPRFYKSGVWQALPDPIVPPAELMGPARASEKERAWAAMTTIPIDAEATYVIAKAGPPRHYMGHLHGLRDTFLTARWDGTVLSVLGREELPIEPDDTFATPDRQLWNVDNQGLWSFSGGHWRLVMRSAPESRGSPSAKLDSTQGWGQTHPRSAIGERLHFAERWQSPFYGLPSASSSWSLVRLDSNETGGVPLIDEVPVKIDGQRLLIRDLTIWANLGEDLLLATDQGLCAFSIKWGNCPLLKPEGLRDEVSLFMRDGTKRLWLGGRGLWVLRDPKQADPVHPAIPMLSDTRVVALAEAPDGRLIIGSEDRGTVFLTIPPGWFRNGESLPPPSVWDSIHPHEPLYVDPSVVLRTCSDKAGQGGEVNALVSGLRDLARIQGGRTRVEQEETFDGKADLALRGSELKPLLDAVLPLVEKLDGRRRWRVFKRFGPRGSNAIEVRGCVP